MGGTYMAFVRLPHKAGEAVVVKSYRDAWAPFHPVRVD